MCSLVSVLSVPSLRAVPEHPNTIIREQHATCSHTFTETQRTLNMSITLTQTYNVLYCRCFTMAWMCETFDLMPLPWHFCYPFTLLSLLDMQIFLVKWFPPSVCQVPFEASLHSLCDLERCFNPASGAIVEGNTLITWLISLLVWYPIRSKDRHSTIEKDKPNDRNQMAKTKDSILHLPS